ncbi:MAG: alpha/beta fold hydrolase [Synechocystis sp.]
MGYQRRDISLHGLNYTFWEWGQPGQQPLLCLHGLGDQGLVWACFADYLTENFPQFHIVAPDLRGHGDSAKPATGYHFADYQTDLDSLLTYFGWQSVDVVAHSWGAKLACRWVTANPQKVRRLVLTDPFFIGTIPGVFKLTFPLLYRVLSFLKLSQSFSSYDAAETLAKTLPEFAGWSPYQQQVFQATMQEQGDGTWTSKFSRQARDEVFEQVMSVPGLTETLDLPCLLFKPDRGVNRSAWQIAPLKQYFPQLTVAEVAGNHWSFLVNPEDFNPRVAKFLLG